MVAAAKQPDPTPLKIRNIRGVRSPALKNLGTMLTGSEIKDTLTILGHTFLLQTLNYDMETWADQFIMLGSPVQTSKSRRAPYVAAAIVSMTPPATDEHPKPETLLKADMFSFGSEMDPETQAYLEAEPIEMAYWLNRQMLTFLAEEGNTEFVTPLWNKLSEMMELRKTAMDKLQNFGKRTPSGGSEATS